MAEAEDSQASTNHPLSWPGQCLLRLVCADHLWDHHIIEDLLWGPWEWDQWVLHIQEWGHHHLVWGPHTAHLTLITLTTADVHLDHLWDLTGRWGLWVHQWDQCEVGACTALL